MKTIILRILLIFVFFSISYSKIENNINEDFLLFFMKFLRDQAFQKERVIYPFIEFYSSTLSTEEDEVSDNDTIKSKSEWIFKSINHCNNVSHLVIDKNLENSDTIIFTEHLIADENVTYNWYFCLVKNKWHLFKRDSYGD